MSYYIVPFQSENFIAEYKDKSHQQTLRKITASMALAIENNNKRNQKKADLITMAWSLFLAGMSAVSIFIIVFSIRMIK